MSERRVLVTGGGAGFIGGWLALESATRHASRAVLAIALAAI